MKTHIICEANYHGNTEFRCAKCGKHLQWSKLAKYEQCPACENKFKNKIKVVKYRDAERKI
jgi:DNA-directed RNA polymerase subunit RPC12/RpoP